MRLVRFGEKGFEAPGCIDSQDRIRDLSSVLPDFDGDHLSPQWLARLRTLDLDTLPVVAEHVRLGAPVARPPKFLAIGLNYADHAAESGSPIPSEPVLFMKATSCLSGPNDDVVLPRGSQKTDWEVELGIVIGSTARYVAEDRALDHVAGFVLVNDVSEREYQIERGGQWDKGKGCDTFGPVGPWLATRDEIEDVQSLGMWLDVNGRRMQTGSTKTMIFSAAYIISYLSGFLTLEPGDIITTGTPPGVGMGRRPPEFLRAGDEMRLGIDQLGEQCQRVIAST